ncbi:MAG: hypothetical protein KGD61_08805, partial [Candidatus Lokiarchaeota archaeon]|nr:hypothetical protein [Candidatus Lokiarchaeota archaeon]
MTIKLKKQVIEILKALKKKKTEQLASTLAKELNIDYIVLMAAINDLIDHDLGGFREEEINQISLNDEGRNYLENGLPENQLLKILRDSHVKEITMEELLVKSKLEKQIFYVGLSNMRKNGWIAQSKATGDNKIFLVIEEFPETDVEKFMKTFKTLPTCDYSKLSKNELLQFNLLNKRKLFTKEKKTQRYVFLTNKGKLIKMSDVSELKQISKITSEMLSSGSWKNYDIKPFDVTKPGPSLKAGKIHPLVSLINKIREVFISMGFTEIRGPIVESAFFNFDALFQPQDHPARELQDTFYLNNPKFAKLPEKDRVLAVKNTHENGGDSNS